jgi:hypothetical protein
MPNTYNSYHTVAEQIINFNNNVVQILQNINNLTTTNAASVNLTVTDSTGAPTVVSMPSFSYLQSEINRMNNNINTLYGLNNNGAIMKTGPNSFQRIITVDLNLEPADITQISVPSSFISKRNSLFDNLLDPELYITVDLTDKIDMDVKNVLYRRYIVEFEINSAGSFTDLGQSALNSFNNLFNGKSNIVLNDFLLWQQSTPGILSPANPSYDENTIDLTPNELQYSGVFTVLYSEIDSNNTLWYYIDTLTYTEILTSTPKQLAIGDSLIINTVNSNTIYQVNNISTSSSNFKINLTAITGNQPIPIGVNTLKLYSPILKDQNVNISVGYNERNVLFIKALNTTNYLLSRNWSQGIGYFTNDLVLSSQDSNNGTSMVNYYASMVSDYGTALKDLVHRSVPVNKGIIPTSPDLNANNFQVVQTNIHLTNTPNVDIVKNQAAQVATLDTQLQQISNAIQSKNKQIQVTRFSSDADKQQANNDLATLQTKYTSTSNLKDSVNSQILSSSTTTANVTPTFAVRGFWTIPAPAVATYSTSSQAGLVKPQQIVKFDVQYKRLAKDGTEPATKSYKLFDTSVGVSGTSGQIPMSRTNTSPNTRNSSISTRSINRSVTEAAAIANDIVATPSVAAFSNWTNLTTTSLKRVYDAATDTFTWIIDDINNPDTVNINQLDIPIHPNESIQIRIRSISEVGFPDSPLYSEWSNTVTITFPDSLLNVNNNLTQIMTTAQQESIKSGLINTLNTQGLNDLLSQKTVVNNTTYYLPTNAILSGFRDANGNALDLYTYLESLVNKISELEAIITNAQGKLVVTVYKNSQKFTVQKNTALNFTVNCEDYLSPYVSPNVPSGRVYANNVYVIKDFFLTIQNSTPNSTLGLLSSTTYTAGVNTDVYNSSAPQVFWVNDQDELITSDVTGISKTQIDNQFLWSVNYDSINQTTVTPLSQNIGNLFTSNGNNSLTNILSSTEYNLGYSDTSVLSFVGNNKSLIDSSKWIDTTSSISSTNKLLTSIHPSVQQLTDIQETNSQLVHTLTTLNQINIPLNIYFKMNALDNTQTGVNYQYINLTGVTQNVRHIKELKFLFYNQADNSPFSFTIKFTINRIKSIQTTNVISSNVNNNLST